MLFNKTPPYNLFFILSLFIISCNQDSTQETNTTTKSVEVKTDTLKRYDADTYFYLKNAKDLAPNSKGEIFLYFDFDSSYVNPKDIKQLDLGYGKFDTLPLGIFKLTNLEYLNMSMKNFSTIPPEIGQLIKLKKLEINHSFISTLPKEIGQLAELKTLGLLFSNVKTLPNSMSNLQKLQEINLGGTPMKHIPPVLKELNSLNMLYLFREHSKDNIPQSEIDKLKKHLKYLNILT